MATVRGLLADVARHTSAVFLATFAIQVTTFALIAVSALLMTPEQFARLSMITAATMLANAFFDLGLATTMTKRLNDTGDTAHLRTAFAVWLAMLPLSAVIGGVAWLAVRLPDIALGIVLGSILNIWNGMRAADQAREDYASFMRSSLAFAAVRLLAGGAAILWLGDPAAIAVAIYVLPLVALPYSQSFQYLTGALAGERKPVGTLIWYAAHVYIASLAFIALAYVPQFFLAARATPAEVGTYGLILTFVSPISLLVYSLRSVLLPKFLGTGQQLEAMLWSARGLAAILAAWGVLMAGGLVVGLGLEQLYGAKYPGIQSGFTIFFAGFSGTAMIGLYSISVHTLGAPHLSMAASVLRLSIMIAALALWGRGLDAIIALASMVMLVGEIILIAALARRRRQ